MNQLNGRVYETLSANKLLRLKSFFIFCKSKFLVRNMHCLYNASSNIIGQKATNKLIKLLYGDIFLGGETIKELSITLTDLKKEGLISIADYARESLLSHEEKVNVILTHRILKPLSNTSKTLSIYHMESTHIIVLRLRYLALALLIILRSIINFKLSFRL
jgi:hypothetical protein